MAKESEMEPNGKPRRGRPPKAEKHARVAKLIGPEGVKTLFASFRGEMAMPHDVFLHGDVDDRFESIGKLVEARLKEVRQNAANDPKEAASTWTPWLTAQTPEQRLEDLARRQNLNERVVNYLLGELGTHLVLSMKIESAMKEARRTAIDRALKVPKTLQEFIVKLHAAGLKTASVKDMSTSAITALSAILNGDADPELVEAIGLGRSTRYVSDEEAEQAAAESRRMSEERHRLLLDEVPELAPDVIKPVVPVGYEDTWNYAMGPLPPEYWSTIQTFDLPYRWEYRMARPDEEESVLGMPLPEAHDWTALREWSASFREGSMPEMRNQRNGIRTIKEWFAIEKNIAREEVNMNTIKAWILLLVGRYFPEAEMDRLLDPGFFDGIVIPCVATGPGIVRELVRK